jgi:hypothetical protein
VFLCFADEINLGFVHTVWNLAAPLSVETAKNPKIAEQVTINGMRNVPPEL